MKKSILKIALACVTLTFILFSCTPKKDAATYNNEMITLINKGQTDMDAINRAMQKEDFEAAKKAVQNWVDVTNKTEEAVTKLGDFNGDATLQKSVLDALKIYKDVANNDYPALIKEREGIKAGTVTTTDNENKMLDAINTKLENAGNAVNNAVEAFQKRNK